MGIREKVTVDATAEIIPTETEAKFDVDRDFDPPDLRDLVGRTERLPDERLQTVYFDTFDRRLRDRDISLRHRTARHSRGTDSDQAAEMTWTLKLPEPAGSEFLNRNELSWPGEVSEIAPEALRILRGIVRRAQLQPVAELETTRRRLLLGRQAKAKPFAELDDDLVKVVGGPRQGREFRQIEIELTGTLSPKAKEVIASLRRSGAKPSKLSKIEMALGDSHNGRGKPRNRERETIADTVKASIRRNFRQLLDHDVRIRMDPDRPDPHDVHQARVATRRLRSDLKTFGSYLDPVWLNHTRDELRWIGLALGTLRDIDVLSGNLSDAGATSLHTQEGTDELLGMLLSGRSKPVQELRRAMESNRYIDLLDRLHVAQDRPPVSSGPDPTSRAAKTLPALVDKRWRSVRRNIRRAGSHPDDDALHKVRIRAKRLRYAAETAVPVIGGPARTVARAAESLQDALGELRDSEAAEAWVKATVKQPQLSPAATFAAGVIARDHELHQKRLRQQWKSEWRAVKRSRPAT